MRLLGFPLFLSIAGCGTTEPAPDVSRTATPREFFEVMRISVERRDARTLWRLSSKRGQEKLLQEMRAALEKMRRDPQAAQAMKEALHLKGDPTAADPEVLAIAVLEAGMRGGYFQGTPRWVRAEECGDEATLTVEWKKGDAVQEENQFLVREAGLWRYK